MSKKSLAILLAVVMVITAAFGTVTVSAEGLTNYITDGGFDNPNSSVTYADATTHKLNPINSSALNNLWGGGTASGVVHMEVVNEDGNNYAAARFKGSNGSGGYYVRPMVQAVALEPSTEYTLSFTAKRTYNCSVEILAGVLAGDNIYKSAEGGKVSNATTKLTIDSVTWKNYTLNFTTDATNTNYAIIFGNNDKTVYDVTEGYDLDNVVLYKSAEGVFVDAEATVGGTVSGGGVAEKGDTVTLTATAKSGYKFVGWSDGETAATRTITANKNVNLTANFEKLSADFVPNGDFEADDWVLSDYWTILSGNAAFTEVADPADATNTAAYAKGGVKTSLLSKNTVTLKQGHTYVIKFDSYMANLVSGNGTNFYRIGFLKPGSADLAGASFVSSAFYSAYNNTASSAIGSWKNFVYEYTHSGADTEVNIVLGMYNADCTSDWYLDNIVAYDKADLCEMTVTADKGGSVIGAKSTYFIGEELTLTAVAKSGFEFAGWSDGVTDATRTVSATAGANYHAVFTGLASDNLVLNGDFEADDWTVADAWGVVNASDQVFQKGTEENGNNYAATVPNQRNSLASDVITVKPGEKYVIEFDYYFVDSGAALTGDTNGFYRYGFIEASKTDLGGSAFTALAGNNYGSFAPALQKDDWFGVWKHMVTSYTNTSDADVQVKAVIGYYNNECGYEWRVDNVRIYNPANALSVKADAENGSATVSYANAYIIKGDKVTLTATPEKDGYEFLGWFVNDTLVSESEVYTATVTESTTFTAKYKVVIPPAYSIVNGDFEANDNIDFATNITGSDNEGIWAKVGTGVNMFAYTAATEADPDFVGNGYALATVPAEGYVRSFGQFVTLKENTEYVLEFAAKSNILTNDATPYSPVYGGVIKRMSGNYGVHPNGNAKNIISDSAYATVSADGEWNRYKITFNSGNNTEVAVAFGGNAMATTGMYFAVDNVVLYESKSTSISNFENGADGWTATDGATVTTSPIAGTALASFGKYLGNTVGVITPAAEGDVFTSPAFNTVVGETYDVVIYTRHNSADDTRGNYSFTANGAKENLSIALYGRPADGSEHGKYENDDGFMVNPIVMGGNESYDSGTFTKLILTFTATAESHNITITTNAPVSAFIDGFNLYAHSDTVELAQSSIGFKGTAIRTTGLQGLRFKNSISVDALAHLGNYAKVVEYGTLAIKEEYKDGEIIVENLTDGKYDYTKSSGTTGCRLKVGVAYKAENGTDVVFAEDLYNRDFTGVLTGISEENYTANYVTRVYAKVQFADGSFTYVYGDEQVASVYAVAEHIVNNGLESAEIRDYLNTNILGK